MFRVRSHSRQLARMRSHLLLSLHLSCDNDQPYTPTEREAVRNGLIEDQFVVAPGAYSLSRISTLRRRTQRSAVLCCMTRKAVVADLHSKNGYFSILFLWNEQEPRTLIFTNGGASFCVSTWCCGWRFVNSFQVVLILRTDFVVLNPKQKKKKD